MFSGILSIMQEDMLADILAGLEQWCTMFNIFSRYFFLYMKYIFFFILLLIAILTFAKFRGIYRISRTKFAFQADDTEGIKDGFKGPRLTMGIVYLILAFGILFNFVTYFMIIILDPLPDRLIFGFINFSGYIDPEIMNRIQDIELSIHPHEQSIYYGVAMASFGALLDVIISIYYLAVNTGKNYKKPLATLIAGVSICILTGFTTCLPLFL
jgi:hypothetical protein